MSKNTHWESVLDDLPKRKAPPYLYTRIQAGLDQRVSATQRFDTWQRLALTFLVICLFGMNLWYFYGTTIPSQNTSEVINDEYDLTPEADYALY